MKKVEIFGITKFDEFIAHLLKPEYSKVKPEDIALFLKHKFPGRKIQQASETIAKIKDGLKNELLRFY